MIEKCPNCGRDLHRIGSFEDLGDQGDRWRKYKIVCKFDDYESDWIDETEKEDLEANHNYMADTI
jgi:hypothetical protein